MLDTHGPNYACTIFYFAEDRIMFFTKMFFKLIDPLHGYLMIDP